MPQATTPLPRPRYPIVRKFPIATLAPYVGLSTEALGWCAGNRVDTIADVLRTMRPQGKGKVIKCPPTLRGEFERLIDPLGIPADWPLHPNEFVRIEQQFAHTTGVYGIIRWAMAQAGDSWSALQYLIHFEDDFLRHKRIGPVVLPKVLAWRDEMRQRHAKPEQPLTADVLTGGIQYALPRQQPSAQAGPADLASPRGPSRSQLSLTLHLDLTDPQLVEKLKAVKAILG